LITGPSVACVETGNGCLRHCFGMFPMAACANESPPAVRRSPPSTRPMCTPSPKRLRQFATIARRKATNSLRLLSARPAATRARSARKSAVRSPFSQVASRVTMQSRHSRRLRIAASPAEQKRRPQCSPTPRRNSVVEDVDPRPRRLELRNDRTRRGCQYLLRIRIICSLAKGLPPSPADALGLQAGRFGDTVWLRRSGVICHLTNDALTYFSAMIANSTIVMIAPFFRLATTRIIRV